MSRKFLILSTKKPRIVDRPCSPKATATSLALSYIFLIRTPSPSICLAAIAAAVPDWDTADRILLKPASPFDIRAVTAEAPRIPNILKAFSEVFTTTERLPTISPNECILGLKSSIDIPAALMPARKSSDGLTNLSRTCRKPVPIVDARIPLLDSSDIAAAVSIKVTPVSSAIVPT